MFLVQTTQDKFENGWTFYSEKASDVFRSHYTEKKMKKQQSRSLELRLTKIR